MGVTDLNSILLIRGSLSNGSNCLNYVNSLIGTLNSQNQTDLRLVNDSLLSVPSLSSKTIF